MIAAGATNAVQAADDQAVAAKINSLDPCTLASADEVSQTMGSWMTASAATKMQWMPQCNYSASGDSRINVLYVSLINAANAGTISFDGIALANARNQSSMTPIAGLAREAFLNKTTGNLLVLLDNGLGFTVGPAFQSEDIKSRAGNDANYVKSITELGQIMAQRLAQ